MIRSYIRITSTISRKNTKLRSLMLFNSSSGNSSTHFHLILNPLRLRCLIFHLWLSLYLVLNVLPAIFDALKTFMPGRNTKRKSIRVLRTPYQTLVLSNVLAINSFKCVLLSGDRFVDQKQSNRFIQESPHRNHLPSNPSALSPPKSSTSNKCSTRAVAAKKM